MRHRGLLLSCILFVFLQSVTAQSPAIEWHRLYGGSYGEYAFSIVPTNDGGYIVSGVTEGTDNGDVMGYHGNFNIQDYWVIKLNKDGKMEWQKSLGGTYAEVGAFIKQTPDGGYIAVGSSASVDCMVTGNHGGLDYWMVKLTATGELVWQKSFGGSKNEYAWSFTSTADGGYIIAGDTESNNGDVSGNHGDRDFWIVKVDATGNLLWQKCLGGSLGETAYSVTATPDGGCVASGVTESTDGDVSGNHGKTDYWVVKLSATGNLQWQTCLGGSEYDESRSVIYTANGGILVAGSSGSNNGDVSGNHQIAAQKPLDIWLVKLNLSGAVEWQKCYGGYLSEMAYNVRETTGGYLVCGDAQSSDGDVSCNEGQTDMWLFKISNTGVLQWQKSFGGDYFDKANCVEPTADGGCIVAGSSCSSDLDGLHINYSGNGTCTDFWIVKLSSAQAAPPAPVVKIDPASATICSGKNAVFRADATYAGLRPEYYWTKNGGAVGGNSPTYTTTGLLNNDVIACTVVSSSECGNARQFAKDAVTINVNNNPAQQTVQISASQTVLCSCSTVRFTATVTNAGASAIYKWKLNGVPAGRNAAIFESSSLKGGDVIICEYTDNLTCSSSGFIVSNAVTMTSGTISPTVSIIASRNSICSGEQVQFTATPVNAGLNPTYQWKINGVNDGSNQAVFTTGTLKTNDTVSCVITGDPSFTCSNALTAVSNKLLITVQPKTNPAITISSPVSSICKGTAVSFTATTAFAGNKPSYRWMINGMTTGNNDSVLTSSLFNNGDVISCELVVDAAYSCTNSSSATSNSITMEVLTGAPASVRITALNNTVCEGTRASFRAIASNAGSNPLYAWKVNGQPAGSNRDTFSITTLKNGDEVSCILTPGAGGCSASPVSSNSLVMTISPLPVINITPVDTLVMLNSQVRFQTLTSEPPAGFSWYPAQQLVDASMLSPQTIPLTDNSIFTLRVTNANGCEAEKKVNVFIYQSLLMPNAFTPNADGLNDVFAIPANVRLQLSEFVIYNRWGQVVFMSRHIAKGWDGTIQGKQADQGLYMYSIKGTNEQGAVRVKGTVLLLR